MAKKFRSEYLRNVAIIGNSGSGKTSLVEALLFQGRARDAPGNIHDRTTVMDTEKEEHQCQHSVTSSLAWLEYRDRKINLLDLPGLPDFSHDAEQALRGADAAVLVVNAAEGVRDQDALMFHRARALGLPVTLFVNQLDHTGADADACVQELEQVLGIRPAPLQLPIGQGSEMRGVLSLFTRSAYIYREDGTFTRNPLSPEQEDEVEGAWLQLTDTVAETDEEMLMVYLETFELTLEQVKTAFQSALIEGRITPVLFGAATRCIGSGALLELICWAFPSPIQRAPLDAQLNGQPHQVVPTADGTFLAQVIHSRIDDYGAMRSLIRIFSGRPPVAGNVLNTSRHISEQLRNPSWLRGRERSKATSLVCGDIIAVKKLKGSRTGDTLSINGQSLVLDHVKPPELSMAYIVRSDTLASDVALQAALDQACIEDGALHLERDAINHQLRLRGIGPVHLDVTLSRIRRRAGLRILTEHPPIAYRETLRAPAVGVIGEHRRRPNGIGVFGFCTLDIAPLEDGAGLVFINHLSEDELPQTYVAAIEKGIRDRMGSGFLAGYPIRGLQVELRGSEHDPADSKEAAYQVAAARALQQAFSQQGAVMLEPLCELQLSLPAADVQAVMNDLMSRRASIRDMKVRTQSGHIMAWCPESELANYRKVLASMTNGRGFVSVQPAGYEVVPVRLVDEIVAASPFRHSELS
jgi:elongation factor G